MHVGSRPAWPGNFKKIGLGSVRRESRYANKRLLNFLILATFDADKSADWQNLV